MVYYIYTICICLFFLVTILKVEVYCKICNPFIQKKRCFIFKNTNKRNLHILSFIQTTNKHISIHKKRKFFVCPVILNRSRSRCRYANRRRRNKNCTYININTYISTNIYRRKNRNINRTKNRNRIAKTYSSISMSNTSTNTFFKNAENYENESKIPEDSKETFFVDASENRNETMSHFFNIKNKNGIKNDQRNTSNCYTVDKKKNSSIDKMRIDIHKVDANGEKRQKILLIIGVTCSGKTQFSIDLCNELLRKDICCEIVSADSMQVYQNFHIGISKINEKDKRNVKHHLLDVCNPNDTFNVHKFVKYSIPIIKNLSKENKLTVFTGGTMLYIESLLWETIVDLNEEEEEGEGGGKEENSTAESETRETVLDNIELMSNEELHRELQKVDAERANQLHPNDRKRICRSLKIYFTHKKKHSELIQMKNHKNNRYDGMRFFPCVFYLDIDDDEVLKKRIANRVDFMLANGLIEEAVQLKIMQKNETSGEKKAPKLDSSFKGIYQSIAYKEFDEYVEHIILNNKGDENLFKQCKDNLVRKTYQYAKRQRRWILNRFVKTYKVVLHRVNVAYNYEEQLKNAVNTVLQFLKK